MLPSDSLLVQLAKSWLRLLECSVDWQSCHSSTSLPLLHSLSLFVLLSFFFFFFVLQIYISRLLLFPFSIYSLPFSLAILFSRCYYYSRHRRLIERNPFFFPPIFSNPVHPPLISLVIPSPRASVKLPSLHRLSSVYTVKCPALISVGKHCKFLLTRLPSRYHVKLAESIDHLCGSDAFLLPPPPYFDPLAKTGKNSEKGKKKEEFSSLCAYAYRYMITFDSSFNRKSNGP